MSDGAFVTMGVLPMRPNAPGFATPVFRSKTSNALWYQTITDDERIGAFGEIDPALESRLLTVGQPHGRGIGDEALYGFVKQDEGTLVGPRRELAEALRPEIDKMPQRPHLRHAIARFMGDTSLAAIAERDIAGWWKQFDKPREVRRPRIFVSCVDEDRAMVRELLVHLRVIEREFPASIWHDGQLRAGSVWNAEIKNAIDQSDVFILLLSPAYTGSIYIRDHELPAIRVRFASGDGVLVLPVVLQRCMWKLFGSYSQMTPHDGQHVRPISDWRPMQKGYAAAAQEIANSIEKKFGMDPDLGTPKTSLIRDVVK